MGVPVQAIWAVAGRVSWGLLGAGGVANSANKWDVKVGRKQYFTFSHSHSLTIKCPSHVLYVNIRYISNLFKYTGQKLSDH